VVGPVVSRAWWQAHAGEVVLADVRRDVPGRTARAAYASGHLPGAVFVDLERWLAGPPSREHGRHPLPSPEVFADGMARAGIGDGDVVVAYDDAAGVVAARLVWMLRVTGHGSALLDGGMRPADPRETGPAEPARRASTRRTFTPCPWPAAALAALEDVTDPGSVVLDARSAARFAGAPDPLDPRPGHLPGARSLPCGEAVDADGLLLPDAVLRGRLADVGVDGSTPVISSCGSGVTACHTLLVMERLGLRGGRLYPGSWSQWAADPDRPVELGPAR
jgi:thiosulfate/3-mercaptopyruvate sulfurtransferase